jgi:hypothetical protein
MNTLVDEGLWSGLKWETEVEEQRASEAGASLER